MLEQIKLYFMGLKKKLSYLEERADKVGYRNFNGKESVLYLLGNRFYEVFMENGHEDIRVFRDIKELKSHYGKEMKSMAS